MQTPPSSLTLSQFAGYLLVAIISAIVGFLGHLLPFRVQSKKLPSEIHKAAAEADLASAQARHFDLADNLTAGEFLSRIFQQLFDAHKRSDQLLSELEAAKKEIGRIPAMEAELRFLNTEVHRARAQGFLTEDRGRTNPAA